MKTQHLRLWIPRVFFGLSLLATSAVAQRGRLDHGTITSQALTNNLLGDSATRRFIAYLPPSYDFSSKRYPVVFVLHGYPGDETSLVANLQPMLDSMILQRRIGEMIAIFVNANNRLSGSWYLSSPVIGDYETYITSDLVSLVDSRYRTLASRESRGIHGMSIGSWGAMHLALKFPETFYAVVAESGLYNSRSPHMDLLERQLAFAHPTNLTQFSSLLSQSPPYSASIQALFCGMLPDTQRPGLYSDYVYEWTNSAAWLSDSADQRCRSGDVQNGDLPRYVEQEVRLGAIKIIHGTADDVIPIADARSFTNVLAQYGIPFTYQEHSGGHDYRPDLALPFFSTNLSGSVLYVAPPRLTFSPGTNTVQISFPTQAGVNYSLETSQAFDPSNPSWTETGQYTGTGLTASFWFPLDLAARFFRVIAANAP